MARRVAWPNALDDVLDLLGPQRPGFDAAGRKRRGLQLQAARADQVAIRDQVRQRLVPGVEDLQHGGSAAAFRRGRQLAQARDERIVGRGELIGKANAARGHV
jgi:hypothetical protein